ncbi:hypothetical protein XHV734_0015 [Xanthomonas hortorum pv. vitians]|nr:hypothetical protein XHV734_0015 [Xanthomonas hortorum pv. vitians]
MFLHCGQCRCGVFSDGQGIGCGEERAGRSHRFYAVDNAVTTEVNGAVNSATGQKNSAPLRVMGCITCSCLKATEKNDKTQRPAPSGVWTACENSVLSKTSTPPSYVFR